MAIKLGPVLNATARISQRFGENPDFYKQYGFNGHEGVDLAADPGVIVASATGGSVLSAGDTKGNYGNTVVIWDADQNCKTLYAHLQDIAVKTNDVISDGATIGHVGGTGKTSGWHLHFSACRTQVIKKFSLFDGTTTIQTADPINPNNGYKGWEDPLDASIFDWPKMWLGGLGPSGQVPSIQGGVSGFEATGAVLTWDEIFAKYYIGWGETEALANFNIDMHGDINLLYIARGIDPNAPVKPPRIRDEALNKKYYLINALGGLTLNEIHSGGISLGRVDLLSGFLGIDPNFNIPAGHEFNLAGFPAEYYPDSSEWIGFKKMVGLDPIGVPGDWFIRPQDAGKTLFDIRGEYNMAFRTDVLASYLKITDRMKIPGYQGFGTSGFPNFADEGSGEVKAFKTLFSQTAPQQTKPPAETGFGKTIEMPPSVTAIPPESIPEAAEEIPQEAEQPPAEQPPAGEGGATLDSIDAKIDTIIGKIDALDVKVTQGLQEPAPEGPPAEEATGGIFIASTPARASIYIDGAFQYDYTPSNFTYKIKPGTHEVRLKLKGYQEYRENVTIVENVTLNLDISLVAV
jgi:hypothetical protein